MIVLLVIVGTSLGAAYALRAFLLEIVTIMSDSMSPTLQKGRQSCCHAAGASASAQSGPSNCAEGARLGPSRGCIGDTFRKPNIFCGRSRQRDRVIKRVAAIPGDTVVMRYEGEGSGGPNFRDCPTDHIFVLGDNRCASRDSRDYGSVHVTNVEGRALCVIWPIRCRRLALASPISSAAHR
jgi:signal peptidase I